MLEHNPARKAELLENAFGFKPFDPGAHKTVFGWGLN